MGPRTEGWGFGAKTFVSRWDSHLRVLPKKEKNYTYLNAVWQIHDADSLAVGNFRQQTKSNSGLDKDYERALSGYGFLEALVRNWSLLSIEGSVPR